MKLLIVVVTILALAKPPRPSGRTLLMENGFKLKVNFFRMWYLPGERREERRSQTWNVSFLFFSPSPKCEEANLWLALDSPLADVGESQRVDGLAGHVAGEAALRLVGHRLVEGHVQEAQVRPLLCVLDQRGGFTRACVIRSEKKNICASEKLLQQLQVM